MADTKNDVKEIDLLELFASIGKGIKNMILGLLKGIVFLISFGIKRAHWLALFVIAGALVGLLVYSTTSRYYSSHLIAQPNGIKAYDMVEYINDLNRFTTRKNIPALTNSLNLDEATAQKVKNIEAFYYLDVNKDGIGDLVDLNKSYNPRDTNIVLDNKRIYVQVEVLDNQVFAAVSKGLFEYIAKNPYLIQLNQIRKKELEEMVSMVSLEIAKLDSLQNVDYFKSDQRLESGRDSRLMFLSEKDKQMYYKDKVTLTRQKQNYLKELEMATEPLTVIKDFTALTMEENPKSGYIIKFGFWFGVMGFVILLFVKYKEIIYAKLIE